MEIIKIFTDGACSSNIGGWAYYINHDVYEQEEFGAMLETTNNRMEIEAVIRALSQVCEISHLFNHGNAQIIIYSDSELVVNTMNPMKPWQRKKNQDKWEELDKVINKLKLKGFMSPMFIWVKGHSKDTDEISLGNKRVDKLAVKAKEALQKEVKKFI